MALLVEVDGRLFDGRVEEEEEDEKMDLLRHTTESLLPSLFSSSNNCGKSKTTNSNKNIQEQSFKIINE